MPTRTDFMENLRGKTLRVYTVPPYIAVTLQKEEQDMMHVWKVNVKFIKQQLGVSILLLVLPLAMCPENVYVGPWLLLKIVLNI